MRFLKETTSTFSANQRHTYMVSKDRYQLFGYVPNGTKKAVMFNLPKQFNPKDRTFTETR
jgi:hypothetical protein